MKSEYLERLRETDIRKITFYLSEEISVERDSERRFLKAVLLSYVAYITGKNNIDTSKMSIEELTESISSNEIMKNSILENLRREKEKIEELKEMFTDDEMLGFIMFSDARKFGRFMLRNRTDWNLEELQRRILDIKSGDVVVEFGSSDGRFLIETGIKEPGAKYYGYEENIVTNAIANVRKELVDAEIDISEGNYYNKDFGKIESPKKILFNYERRFTTRGIRRTSMDIMKKYNITTPARVNTDWMINFYIINILRDGDKAITFISPGTAFRDFEEECRKVFVEKGFIESVIALPENMSYRMLPSSLMMVLSRNNKKIRFIDASEMCEEYGNAREEKWNTDEIMRLYNGEKDSRTVEKTVEELRENSYNLNPLAYTGEVFELAEEMKLGDIAEIKRGSQIKVKELDMMKTGIVTGLKYITPSNIENGMITLNNQYLKRIPENMEKYCAETGDILLTKTASPTIKSAVVDRENEKKILVTGNLYIIKVNKSIINPYYLQAFLESDCGKASIKKVCGGAVIPVVSLKELRGLKIPVPDIRKQKKIVDKYKDLQQRLKMATKRIKRIENEKERIFDARKTKDNIIKVR